LRTRRAPRGLPIAPIIRRAHDLGQPLCKTCLLLGDLAHLPTASLALALQRLTDSSFK
jgi:hypothetical protein